VAIDCQQVMNRTIDCLDYFLAKSTLVPFATLAALPCRLQITFILPTLETHCC
jgi:hypothetical protein